MVTSTVKLVISSALLVAACGGKDDGDTTVDPSGPSSGPMSSTTGSSAPGTDTDTMPTSDDPGTSEPTTGASTTTGEAMTGASTTNDTTTSDSTGQTTETTGPGGDYGNCGWTARELVYACADGGGAPGMADPANQHPIDCPARLPSDFEPCDVNGPVTFEGCCTDDGTLYYCDGKAIVVVHCK